MMVKVSAASMRQEFNGCEPGYINEVCHGACCRSSTHPTGIRVALLPVEALRLARKGAIVMDGYLQPDPSVPGRCPAQTGANLCGLHGTDDKPFGCIASPFVLTAKDTLVVRNRYRLLKCYRDGRRLPAYVAFSASLRLLFGETVTAALAAHLEASGGDTMAPMLDSAYRSLKTLEGVRA